MTRLSDFAYAQTRLQARHGMRPDARTWRRLASIGDLLHFLQTARTTPLRPWVLHFTAETSIHDVELSLRAQFRHYVWEVANWQPAPWRSAVLWVKRLPDLPALQHLLLGQPIPRWVRQDPTLQPFAIESRPALIEALRNSDCGPLLQAWQEGIGLSESWLQHWRTLWPKAGTMLTTPLELCTKRIQTYLVDLSKQPAGSSSQKARAVLAEQLTRDFRRHTHQPAATFVHLGLVALDLQQLRGALVRRAVFPRKLGESQ